MMRAFRSEWIKLSRRNLWLGFGGAMMGFTLLFAVLMFLSFAGTDTGLDEGGEPFVTEGVLSLSDGSLFAISQMAVWRDGIRNSGATSLLMARTSRARSPYNDGYDGSKLGFMNTVSDAFLLEVAGIAASLLGFFVVGVFFFVQRGMFPQAARQAQRYMQEATRSVIVLFGMTLLLALGLVALRTSWVSLLYLGLSLVLLWSVARTSIAIRHLHRALEVRVMPQIGVWAAAATITVFPWVLGGLQPDRAHLTSAVVLMAVFAFTSSASAVLFAFQISGLEASFGDEADGKGPPAGGDQESKSASRAHADEMLPKRAKSSRDNAALADGRR